MKNTPSFKLNYIKKAQEVASISYDFYQGSKYVMSEKHIPKWLKEDDATYKKRLYATPFNNKYRPIINAFAGLATKNKPNYKDLKINYEDVDLKGNSLDKFVSSLVKKSLAQGIVFIGINTTDKQAYLKIYDYKQLQNFQIENKELSKIVFRESELVADGKFGMTEQERYTVYEKNGGSAWYKDNNGILKEQETWTNTVNQVAVVPFITGIEDKPFEVTPVFYDLALLNRALLNMDSSYTHLLNAVSNPIPVFYGHLGEDIKVGVSDGIVFSDKQTEGFEFVEVSGNGANAVKNKVDDIEKAIDNGVFEILKNRESKTRVDAEQNRNKLASFIDDIVKELNNRINDAIKIMYQLENKTYDNAIVEFVSDTQKINIDVEEAQKLLNDGNMSRETFYYILQHGTLPQDFDIKAENEKIEAESGL